MSRLNGPLISMCSMSYKWCTAALIIRLTFSTVKCCEDAVQSDDRRVGTGARLQPSTERKGERNLVSRHWCAFGVLQTAQNKGQATNQTLFWDTLRHLSTDAPAPITQCLARATQNALRNSKARIDRIEAENREWRQKRQT